VRFESDKLAAGKAERCENGGDVPSSFGTANSPA
jgi:hypothetical protein